MFKYALLAAAAAANELHLIEATPSNSIAITQLSGQQNWVMQSGIADPDPIQTNNRQYFNVEGPWTSAAGATMDKVQFTCNLQGVQVFKQDFACSSGDANCPLPAGTPGEMWKGVFYFDVPAVAPPFEYDVHVTAFTADGSTQLWQLESKFRI